MPAGTLSSARTAPPRRFENYILTRVVDGSAGLTNIEDSNFKLVPGIGPDAAGNQDVVSNVVPIGFDFEFDNIVYKQFVVSMHGWLGLVDPTLGYFDLTDAIPSATTYLNTRINLSGFSTDQVLLAPWFDDSRALASTPGNLDYINGSYTAAQIARYAAGLEPPPYQYNAVSYGVSYYHDHKNPKGRRVIVRWSIVSNFYNGAASSVLKFECVIYESGTIEYRYTPKASILSPTYAYPSPKGSPKVYSGYEGATIGIFMPGSANRFRDFAVGLGYREGARQEYIYGGYVYDSSYTDSDQSGNPTYTGGGEDYGYSTNYTVNLLPGAHWPGLQAEGSIFTFSPPLNRRVVLPRRAVRDQDGKLQLPLVARTGDDRLGTALAAYDDRRSPEYPIAGGAGVNYPTTLPRFFGGTAPGTLQRQNLFSGDMIVSGTVSKSASEPFLGELPITSTPAFNESRRHDQDEAALMSEFYATGSSIAAVGAGFDQPLRTKTQVRIQLPVATPVAMPGSNSSIFYYNQGAKAWEVPVNSTYQVQLGNSEPPAGTSGGDWASPQTFLQNGQYPEDFRGFGPWGNLVASGTHVPGTSPEAQTDFNFYQKYNNTALVQYIGKSYKNSIRTNDVYAPSPSETFTIPITQPFLLEKATFEIPLAFGAGWFKDQTQCFAPIGLNEFSGTPFDVGGPALTIALMRQIPMQEQGLVGDAAGSLQATATSFRDLIMTGTITHALDYVSGVVLSSFSPTSTTFQMRPVGFLNYANPAGAVVPVPSDMQFTGSIVVQSQATSCNGVDLFYAVVYEGTTSQTTASAEVLLTQPTLPLGSGFFNPNSVLTQVTNFISPFGRNGNGFQQAGRAILGNEYATLQNLDDQTGTTAPNPFYIADEVSDLPAQILQTFKHAGNTFDLSAQAIVSLKSHFPSPYLLMPGDQLVLSISKTRPFTYTQSSAQLSGSKHDVQLVPGNINITLYGSLVAEGVEYHDTLNQPLSSDVCHEVLGNDPVLDQFEPAYRNEYSGSFSDNVMVGELLTSQIANGQIQFSQGVRDRKLSVLNATLSASIFTDLRTGDPTHDVYNYPGGTLHGFPSPLPNEEIYNSVPSQLGLTWSDAALNPSKAFRATPWVEIVGNVRTSQFIDETERYWDSLMPAVDQAFAADGTGIFLTRYGAFGNAQQVNAVTASYIGHAPIGDYLPQGTQPIGWIWFDYMSPALLAEGYNPIINGNWTKGFPFEPRYQGASRQLDVSKGLIATYLYQPQVTQPNISNTVVAAGSPVIVPIPPTQVGGFLFGPVQQQTSVDSTIVGYDYANPIFFWFYILGHWFYIEFFPPIQGLVYTVNDICNTWLADSTVGPGASTGSSAGYFNQYGYYTTSSANINDISRCLFGFGDGNGYFQRTNSDTSVSLLGTGHFAEFRDQEGPHPDGLGFNGYDNSVFKYAPRIRGWKYGVASGIPLFSKAYWRQGKFGQNRDMLEQRLYTKYYESPENNPTDPNFQQGVKEAVVTVKYLSPDGRLTDPANTWSSNLSFECTSSFPYIEGVPTNRPVVNVLALNKHILTFRQDIFGNLRL